MPFLKHGMCNGQQMITGGDPGHDADLGIFSEFLSLRDSAIVTHTKNNFAVSAALVEVSGLQLVLLVTQRASVIGPVCLFVGVWGSVTTITRNCVHASIFTKLGL